MELIIDFLLEYYLWVLVVIVILIITVIGFLVDTKNKKKMREKIDNTQNMSNQNTNSVDANLNNQMLNQNLNTFDPNLNMNQNINDFNNMNAFNQNMNNFGNVNDNMFDQNINTDVNNFNIPNQNVNAFNQNINQDMINPLQEQNIINLDTNLNNQMPNQTMNTFDQNMNTSQNLNNFNNNVDAFFVPAAEQTPAPTDVVIPRPVESTPIMSVGSTPSPVIEPTPVQTQNVNMINPEMNNINRVPTMNEVPNVVATPIQEPAVNMIAGNSNYNQMPGVNVMQNMQTQMVQNQVPNANAIQPSQAVVPNPINPVQPEIPNVVPTHAEPVAPVQNLNNNQMNGPIPNFIGPSVNQPNVVNPTSSDNWQL